MGESGKTQKQLGNAEGMLSRFQFDDHVLMGYENFFQDYDGCAACDSRHLAWLRLRMNAAFVLSSSSKTMPAEHLQEPR